MFRCTQITSVSKATVISKEKCLSAQVKGCPDSVEWWNEHAHVENVCLISPELSLESSYHY